jgi:hypothetical protein
LFLLGACHDEPTGIASSARLADESVPAGDFDPKSPPPLRQSKDGSVLAYTTTSGEVRWVYLLGGVMYAGPKTKGPLDFRAAPERDRALGAMFENTPEKNRAALATEVQKADGDQGLIRMLVDGAGADSKVWEATYEKLPELPQKQVQSGLGKWLDPGKPAAGLLRTVRYLTLAEPAHVARIEKRLPELLDPIRVPRASAVMLRAVASVDPKAASKLGCDVLAKNPADLAKATGSAADIDVQGREELVEAALVAIARDAANGSPLACQDAVLAALADPCVPQLRCADGKPLTGREPTSHWDEPLCTKAELAAITKTELERKASDILDVTTGARRELFALAALAAAEKVPLAIVAAHERRRYAIAEPASPSCESGELAPGTSCHCDEGALRDQTCRNPTSANIHVGLCKWDVDDKSKKITNVVASPPP